MNDLEIMNEIFEEISGYFTQDIIKIGAKTKILLIDKLKKNNIYSNISYNFIMGLLQNDFPMFILTGFLFDADDPIFKHIFESDEYLKYSKEEKKIYDDGFLKFLNGLEYNEYEYKLSKDINNQELIKNNSIWKNGQNAAKKFINDLKNEMN